MGFATTHESNTNYRKARIRMNDPKLVRLVVASLTAITGVALIGTILLILASKSDTQIALVSGIAGTGLGAISALLVSTHSNSGTQTVPPDNGDE